MNGKSWRIAATVTLALGAWATGARAGNWKLVPAGKPAGITGTKLTVTPQQDWNRQSSHPVHEAEAWTLDGPTLDVLYLVAGLEPGKTLYKDSRKKDKPLPQFAADMQLTDIPDFVESSLALSSGAQGYETETVEPAKLSGHPGIAFSFHYVLGDSPLRRKGFAEAALVNGQLYLISFTAPELYYFDHDLPMAKAIMDSAQL